MDLTKYKTCDLCGGHDIGNVCRTYYIEDSDIEYFICPDCVEINTQVTFTPVPTDEQLEWN